MSDISLDNFDYAILRILQKDNKTSHREISEKNWPILSFCSKTYISYGRKGNYFKKLRYFKSAKIWRKLLLLLKSDLAKTALS